MAFGPMSRQFCAIGLTKMNTERGAQSEHECNRGLTNVIVRCLFRLAKSSENNYDILPVKFPHDAELFIHDPPPLSVLSSATEAKYVDEVREIPVICLGLLMSEIWTFRPTP